MADIKIYGTLKNDTGEPIVYATQVKEDARHRFVTDTERLRWDAPVLLPVSGVCGSRADMPEYGVWAFPDEDADGIWTIDGDFTAYGLTRADYCNSVGISGDRWAPKPDAVYQSVDYESGSRLWVVVDAATSKMERMATLGDLAGLKPDDTTAAKVDAANVTTDASRRFVSDAEKQKWNEAAIPALLPIDGVCASRAEMPGYGVWAFAEEEMGGMWTIDGDFTAYGLTQKDYCVSVGIDGSRWTPKPEGVYRCVDNKGVQRIYTVDLAEGKNRLVAIATLDDMPRQEDARFRLPVLPVERVTSVYEEGSRMARSGGMVLSQIAYGGTYKWVLRGDAAVYGLSTEDYGELDASFGFVLPKPGLLLYSVEDVCFYRTVGVDKSVAFDGVAVQRCLWGDAAVYTQPSELTAEDIAAMAQEVTGENNL